MAKGPLVPHHVLVLPIVHKRCTLELSESAAKPHPCPSRPCLTPALLTTRPRPRPQYHQPPGQNKIAFRPLAVCSPIAAVGLRQARTRSWRPTSTRCVASARRVARHRRAPTKGRANGVATPLSSAGQQRGRKCLQLAPAPILPLVSHLPPAGAPRLRALHGQLTVRAHAPPGDRAACAPRLWVRLSPPPAAAATPKPRPWAPSSRFTFWADHGVPCCTCCCLCR